MIKKLLYIIPILLLLAMSPGGRGGADQPDFPLIYIDEGCAGTHVGSEANPYDDLADINWTTGGDNSIFDYLAGVPSQSPYIYHNKGDTWRETMTVGCSGTATYPIVITSYGSGADPIINGTDVISTWTENTEVVGDDSNTDTSAYAQDYIYYLQFTTSGGGAVQSITFYVGADVSGPTALKCAIYTDSANSPNTLVANTTSEEKASIDANSWNTFSVTSGATLSATATYWIAIWSDGTSAFDGPKTASGPRWMYQSLAYTTPFPANATGGGLDTRAGGAYVTLGVTNTWKATLASEPRLTYLDGTQGTKAANLASVDAANEWFWAANVLYVYYTEDPDGAVVIEASKYPTTDGHGLIQIDNKDYITIDGIDMKQSHNHFVKIRNDSTNIYVKNGTFAYSYHGGLIASDTDGGTEDIYFQDNTVSYTNQAAGGAGYHEGVTIEGIDGFEISGNTVHHCAEEGIDAKYGATNGIIFGNTVYSNTLENIMIDGATTTSIYQNKIYDITSDAGIFIAVENDTYPTTDIDIYYNLIWDCAKGIKFYSGGGISSNISGVNIYNNVIYMSSAAQDYCIVWNSSATDNFTGTNNIKNNILWAVDAREAIVDDTIADQGIAATTIANNFFNSDASTDTQGTSFQESTITYMTDPGSDDFTLNPHSPCINAGTDVGLTEDYQGLKIRHAPDIGAHENQASAIFLSMLRFMRGL